MRNFFKRLLGQKKGEGEVPLPLSFEKMEEELLPPDNTLPTGMANDDDIVVETISTPVENEPVIATGFERDSDLSQYQYPTLDLTGETLLPVFSALKETSFSLPLIWSVHSTGIQVRDLADLQSILIAGAPGSGKSNLLHQFILALLYKKHPSQLKFVLLDYKGLDLAVYSILEKHFLAKLPEDHSAIISETTSAIHALNSLCIEMDNRYELMRSAMVKDTVAYNDKFIRNELSTIPRHQYLPAIVLVIDNVDGFFSRHEKEISQPLQRLVTMGYKCGIYVVLTTSDLHHKAVPTELIRLMAERIAFRLNSKEEYRKLFETSSVNISYEAGAFHYAYQGRILGGASVFMPVESIGAVVNFIGRQCGYPKVFLLPAYMDEGKNEENNFDATGIDPLFIDAAIIIVQNQIGSSSLLQRRMKLGYNRAGRLMNQLEAAGIVAAYDGSRARDVLIKTEQELRLHLSALGICFRD
jgi:DNA segregation ATPase FtsK/SpoIIIE and related proteins